MSGMKPMGRITRITIHHSFTKDGRLLNDTEAIRRYHIHTLGWSDIGYHYVIEDLAEGDAQVVNARPIEFQGAHARGENEGNIGICLVGNFDVAEPTRMKYAALARLLIGLQKKYCIEWPQIVGHVYYSHKTCPGRKFNWLKLAQIIETVRGVKFTFED